jgi:hypothetical protein
MATSSSLAEAISALQRRYGLAAVRRGGDPALASIWPTGLPVLDRLLSGGGLPVGRVSVIAGQRPSTAAATSATTAAAPSAAGFAATSAAVPGSTGRLTLLQALLAIASRSMQVAYVDLPGTLDLGYLADLGADLHSCLVVRPPRSAPGPGLAMARTLVRAGVPWVGVAFGQEQQRASALEHPLTALAEAAWSVRAVLCFSALAPLPAPLAYASSLTLGCTPVAWQEAHGDIAGLRVHLEVLKNKVGAPGATAAALLRYPRPQGLGEVVGLPTLLPGYGENGADPAEATQVAALSEPGQIAAAAGADGGVHLPALAG